MCGFVGCYLTGGPFDRAEALREASAAIVHRGPDDSGEWVSGPVAFGYRRLAIQDLSLAGRQPMSTGDGRLTMVFNGEVYNFKILRRELEAKGVRFHGGSDTEVLLKLYEAEGLDALPRLNGMFAIAVHDTREGTVTLARDAFGIKPLYVYDSPKGCFFASEIKALLPLVREYGLDWGLDEAGLGEYFLFRFLAGRGTLVKGLRTLGPGEWLRIHPDGSRTSGRHYDLRDHAAPDPARFRGWKEADYVEWVGHELRESLKLQMISDAPLGVALSGGVDSSLIVGLIRDFHGGDLKTYSVGFPEREFAGRELDESEWCRRTARRYGTDHHEVALDWEGLAGDYLKAVWHFDEPLNFPHSIGIHKLSALAKESVTVLLGGEGADEAFAGYKHFKTRNLYPLKNRATNMADLRQVLRVQPNLAFRESLIAERAFGDGVNKEINYSFNTYLQTIENRLDKMSMAASVEFRVPFLDPNVVAASLALPDRLKVRGGETKWALKKLAERYVPKDQIYRPKVGFSTPTQRWLTEPRFLAGFVDILGEKRTLERGFLKPEGVRRLVARLRAAPMGSPEGFHLANCVWILLSLEMWIRGYLEDRRRIVMDDFPGLGAAR